jgi:hypothetical protein
MEGKKSLIVKENRERKTSQILFLSPSKNRFSKIPTSFSFSTPSLTASFLVSSPGNFSFFANLPPGKVRKGDLRKNLLRKSSSEKLSIPQKPGYDVLSSEFPPFSQIAERASEEASGLTRTQDAEPSITKTPLCP